MGDLKNIHEVLGGWEGFHFRAWHERWIAVRHHARALGRQRIAGFWIGVNFAFAGGQTDIEAAKGDTDGP